MTFSSSTTNTLQNPGQTTVRPPNQFRLPRAPLPTDINANIGDEWEDYSTSPPNFYKLASLFYNTATWRLMTAGAGNVISFSDTANTPVYPSSSVDTPPQNIQLYSSDGTIIITSDPANHKIDFISNSLSSIDITGDSGGALTGSSFTFTGGSTGLLFSGAGTTETLTGIVNLANGGTGVDIASIGDGQLLIGSSTGPLAAANITSTDSSVTITNGANSIDLSVPVAAGLSLSAFGSVPNADGLSLTSGVLNMQPADATHGGGVSIGPQTFAGVKTFASSPILPLTGILIGNGAGAVSATSILPVTQGGTGLPTLTTHSVMLGQATADVAFADPTGFVSGNPLVSQGGGSDPAFSTTATVNQITIVNTPVNPSDGTNKNYV